MNRVSFWTAMDRPGGAALVAWVSALALIAGISAGAAAQVIDDAGAPIAGAVADSTLPRAHSSSAGDDAPGTSLAIAADDSTSILVTGDRLRQIQVSGEPILLLDRVRVVQGTSTMTGRVGRYNRLRGQVLIEGDVQIDDEGTHITGDHGTYDVPTRLARIEGDVEIDREETTIRAPWVIYDRDAGVAHLAGGVEVIDRAEDRRVDADSLIYWRDEGRVQAFGNVRIDDRKGEAIIRGEMADIDRTGDELRVSQRASMVLEDRAQPVLVSADSLYFQSATDRVEAMGGVRVQQGLTESHSSAAVFDRAAERAILTGLPIALDPSGKVRGDTLDLRFRDGELERLIARGNARSIYRPEGAVAGSRDEMRIEGDLLTVRVRDSIAEEVKVVGEAESVYIPGGERYESGARSNRARGDQIRVLFDHGEPLRAVVEGNASGIYTYVNERAAAAAAAADSAAVAGAVAAADSAAVASAVAATDSAAVASAVAATDSVALVDSIAVATDSTALVDAIAAYDSTALVDAIAAYDSTALVDAIAAHDSTAAVDPAAAPDSTAAHDPARAVAAGDPPDAVPVPAPLDSLAVDDDFALTPPAEPDSLLSRIHYQASQIIFLPTKSEILLEEEAELDYGLMHLTADHVTFSADRRELVATGDPVLQDRSDEVRGDLMTYDLETREGSIIEGETDFEQGFYTGRRLHKSAEGVFDVRGACYTTCNLDEPHYHFAGRQMKIYLNDKVVTRPLGLYIGRVPILGLPFYVFPIRRGRHSGLLLPRIEFGVSDVRGRFVHNAGYYWVINDYADLETSADINERSPFFIGNMQLRYAKRYKMNGDVRGSMTFGEDTRRWDVQGQHYQTVGEDLTLRANANFLSDRSFRRDDQGQFVDNRLETQLRSNLELSKSWSTQSLNVQVDRTQNLQNEVGETLEGKGRVTGTFPRISYNFNTRPIGRPPDAKGRGGRWPWLASTSYRFGTTYSNNFDTDRTPDIFLQTASSSASITDRRTVGPLNVGPSFSINAQYVERTEVADTLGNLLPDIGHVMTGTWRTSMDAGTDLFGLFSPTIGPFHGFRHTMTPRVSLSYSDRFDSRSDEDGGDPSGSVAMSLSNRIETRVADGDEFRTLSDFLSFDLATSYDLSNRSNRRFSNIRGNARLRPGVGRGFEVRYSTTYDPYERRNLNYSASSRFSFQRQPTRGAGLFPVDEGATGGTDDHPAAGGAGDTQANDRARRDEGAKGDGAGEEGDAGSAAAHVPVFPQAFRINGTMTFSGGGGGDKKLQGSLGSSFSLTPKWRLTHELRYDLIDLQVVSQSYSIIRDLHCWEAQFRRSFSGHRWEYYFRIAIRDLPQIYYEKGSSQSRIPSLL